MRKFFRFQWLCIRHAWRGCWTFATAWEGGLLGAAILAAILYSGRRYLEELGLIEAPSTYWGVAEYGLALTVASVAVAFLVIFTGRLVLAAPSSLYWVQRERADTLQAELSAARDSPNDGPNWPIDELFSYLEPDVLDRPEANLWQKAGDKIRDAFSLGQLRVWGRPYKTNLGDWIGERAALRLIDKKYWEKAYFTYFFFDATAKDQTHCYADRDTGRPAYTDLQVNRAEVLKLWPGEPDDLAETFPNIRVADSTSIIELFDGSERAKLVGLLVSGKLTGWARRSASTSSDLLPIEAVIWTTHSFHFYPKTVDTGTINQTFLRVRGTINSSHYDVCLNYAQLKRAWPSLNMRRSKCDTL